MIKDIGLLEYVLGVSVKQCQDAGIIDLLHKRYIHDTLTSFGFAGCRSSHSLSLNLYLYKQLVDFKGDPVILLTVGRFLS